MKIKNNTFLFLLYIFIGNLFGIFFGDLFFLLSLKNLDF
jgi:hypothetical protein